MVVAARVQAPRALVAEPFLLKVEMVVCSFTLSGVPSGTDIAFCAHAQAANSTTPKVANNFFMTPQTQ